MRRLQKKSFLYRFAVIVSRARSRQRTMPHLRQQPYYTAHCANTTLCTRAHLHELPLSNTPFLSMFEFPNRLFQETQIAACQQRASLSMVHTLLLRQGSSLYSYYQRTLQAPVLTTIACCGGTFSFAYARVANIPAGEMSYHPCIQAIVQSMKEH